MTDMELLTPDNLDDISQVWESPSIHKRPAVKQGPDLYLEPKWLQYL